MPEAAKSLRITFVIPYFYPAWEFGGQPRSAYELAKALVQRGHRVKVLTTDSGGMSRLRETGVKGRYHVEGIDIVYYRNLSNWLAYRYRFFWPARMLREFVSETESSDILHIHELRSTVSVFAQRTARRLSIPYVLSGHGGLRPLGRPTAKAVYDNLWGRDILNHAAAVIAISPLEETDATKMGVETRRIHRLPNIVAINDYQTLPQPGSFRKSWSLPSGKIILFLGRLHRLKGADLLIEAFSRLNPANNTYLVIAGPDDGQEHELRQAVCKLNLDSRVRFTGFLDLNSKKAAFVDASVVVLPSRNEVFAITAVEALACGTPVLLSSACGLYPLPEPEGSVTFFKSEDVDNLTATLAALIRDGRNSEAALGGAEFVARSFGPDEIGHKAEQIYMSILSQSQPKCLNTGPKSP
jgi:glycosyltransferase involved in cell wall biosynthesis